MSEDVLQHPRGHGLVGLQSCANDSVTRRKKTRHVRSVRDGLEIIVVKLSWLNLNSNQGHCLKIQLMDERKNVAGFLLSLN